MKIKDTKGVIESIIVILINILSVAVVFYGLFYLIKLTIGEL